MTYPWKWARSIEQKLDSIQGDVKKIMASIASILAAQQQEDTDIGLLSTAVTNLLSAFANGQITPAQAQQILTDMQTEDATIQGLSSSINSALGTTPPAATAAALKIATTKPTS